MKIYKFKDFNKDNEESYFLQIILDNSIWCARPDSLKDEDEFKFELNYEPSPYTHELLSKALASYRTTNRPSHELLASHTLNNKRLDVIAKPIIDDLIQKIRNDMGVTSFSLEKNDYLWKEYGGNGNGVCIEINIPDKLVGARYHPVNYVVEKIFHVDSFLESALFPDRIFETIRNILLTKTKKWEQEKEIRLIGWRQDVTMILNDCYISEITFGSNVPTHTLEKLKTGTADIRVKIGHSG